jgi:hypothetical protein
MLHSNYLVELSGFVINVDFIYINPATAEASLVYLPFTSDGDSIKVYKSFLKGLIVNSASIDNNAKDNYLQQILSYLKSEDFSLCDFSRLITDLRNSGGLNESLSKSIHLHRGTVDNEEIAVAGYVPNNRSLKKTALSKPA